MFTSDGYAYGARTPHCQRGLQQFRPPVALLPRFQELLEWRRRQHILARQKNYAEAQKASAREGYLYILGLAAITHTTVFNRVDCWNSSTACSRPDSRKVAITQQDRLAWERTGSDSKTFVKLRFRSSFCSHRSRRLVSRCG